jgi:eukaryotic-like serine/threonine-protein kinase
VMINRDGQVKVTDFGIARAIAEAQMTLPGTTLGSVHYFSPEQARGDQATASSDIYSLGIVLFELLTGHRPWEADSAAAVAMARLAGPPPDPSAIRSGIPSDLVAITRKALATEPADRWSSASSFAAALEAFLGGGAIPGVAPASGRTVDASAPTAAAAAGLAGAATSATARPNPNAIPYTPDAYADDRPPPRVDRYGRDPSARAGQGGGRPPRRDQDDDEPGGTSPAVWAAGIIALLILAAVGFLVFRLLSGPGTTPVAQVTVPEFVGKDLGVAQTLATQNGLTLNPTAAQASGVPVNQITAQDPVAGTRVAAGATINVTVAAGARTVAVPDLRDLSETDAFNALAAAGLTLGPKTEAFDPIVPAGAVISQNPAPGVLVNEGTAIG